VRNCCVREREREGKSTRSYLSNEKESGTDIPQDVRQSARYAMIDTRDSESADRSSRSILVRRQSRARGLWRMLAVEEKESANAARECESARDLVPSALAYARVRSALQARATFCFVLSAKVCAALHLAARPTVTP